jgi:hypothetical protein
VSRVINKKFGEFGHYKIMRRDLKITSNNLG